MPQMRTLGSGELRLLRRLALDPSSRQIDIPKDLGITRCAINQTWKRLENLYHLRIRSEMDLGVYGIHHIFGWARAKTGSKIIHNFHRWLLTSSLVHSIKESTLSSTMDSIILFEAALPFGKQYSWFMSQIERFRKRPYTLSVFVEKSNRIANQMNPGIFDGSSWEFNDGFQFEASIDAMQEYLDVLPASKTLQLTSQETEATLEDLILASAVENNYHVTAADAYNQLKKAGIVPPSTRTLRRRLKQIREQNAMPYLEIENVGLTKKMIVCFREISSSRNITKLFLSQAGRFPRCRIVSGKNSMVLQLGLPDNVDWLKISQMLMLKAAKTTEIFTFIAKDLLKLLGLESVVEDIKNKRNR